MSTVNLLQQPEPFEPGTNANQDLYNTIDAMCKSVSFLDNFPTAKQSKLIQFSVEFCDNYGVSKDAVDVVLKAKMNDDGTRELLIEVAGIVTETITYDAQMAITNRVTASVAGAVVAASGGVNPAGWFMAVATGGAYYALGHVIATATSKAAGEKAKIAVANLWDRYTKLTTDKPSTFELKTPNTEKELFTEEVFNGLSSSLPDGTIVNIYTNSDTNLVLVTVGNKTTMEVHGSQVFNPNADTTDVQEWIKAVASSGATQVSINGSKTYNIVGDNNNLLVRNALDTIPAVSVLLSHIDIYPGDKIDIGDKGIYTVKGGDTFSQIANNNGFNTKELLQKNTWLIDEGKVHFDQNKVFVDISDTDLNKINHTLNGTNADDILKDHNGGNDTLNGNAGNDHLEGGKGSDTLHGGADSDVLLGGTETDYLYGESGNDTLLGGDDASTDILLGGSGQDTLLGQGGDDVLAGGSSWSDLYSEKEHDYLLGGTGFDTYYVSNSDTINDADSNGLIMFNDKSLSGKKRKVEGSDDLYEDDYFVYALNGNDMVVVEKTTQEYITIENFNFNSKGFGIDFSESDPDKQDIELRVGDATTTEGGDLVFNVSINHALKYDLTVDVASYFNSTASTEDVTGELSGTVTITAGETSANFTISTVDDTEEEPTEKFLFAATGYKYAGENKQDNDLGSLLIMNGADGTIKDNETKTPLEVSVSDASLDEANAMMTFTVSLSGVLEDGESLTVEFQTADNTATASYDYASTQKSVTFTKNSMTQTIEVPIYDDYYKENGETFWLTPVSTSGYSGSKGVNNVDFRYREVV